MRLFGSLASAPVNTVAEDRAGRRWILRPFSNRPTDTNRTYCLQRANHLHLVTAFHLAGATTNPSGVRVGWARPAIYIIRADGKVTRL